MTKATEPRLSARKAKTSAKRQATANFVTVARHPKSGQFRTSCTDQVEAVMIAAERSGLLQEKVGRIGGRISPELVKLAKARTGIESDTDLIEFALANIALEDKFAEAFAASRGKVSPDLKLGF